MGRGSTLALLVVFTVGLHTLLARAQVTAQVAYVASETIYLDRGSGDGLMTGDSALIVRNDSVVARLVVTYLAGRTAACRVVGIGSPQAGDRVAIYPTAPRPVIDGGEDSRPRRDTLKAPQRAVVEPSAAAKGRPVPSHLRMRAGYRFYVQNPSGSGGYEYRQSSLMLNGSLERALGSPWSAYWRLRAGSALRTGRPGRREMRLYEARLSWRDAAKPFKLELGRLIPSRAGGVGWVDGAEIGYRLSGNAVTMGAFAGFEPEPGAGSPSDERLKVGLTAGLKSRPPGLRRWSADVALVGAYRSGALDREYAALQSDLALSPRVSLYESLTLAFHRERPNGSTLRPVELNMFLAGGRMVLTPRLSIDIDWSSYRTYRDYDVRQRPDSLFDAALRQGTRAAFRLDLPYRLSLDLSGGLRFGSGREESRTLNCELRYGGIRRLNLSASASLVDGSGQSGYQAAVRCNYRVAESHDLSLEGGRSRTTLVDYDLTTRSDYIRAGWGGAVGRYFYGSSSVEVEKSGGVGYRRGMFEVMVRL